MQISKVIVSNYRSIQRVEVDPSRFTIFVGQNNHGKTNFFEAIEWFYTAKSSALDEHFNRDANNKISVEVFFENVVEADIQKLADINKTKIKNMLGDGNSFSVLKTSVDHKRKYFVNKVDKVNPAGFDTAINEFLPRLEYINTRIRLDDVSKYKDKNPIGAMLSGVLTTIIESSDDYKAFKQQFSKLFDDADSEVRKALNELGGEVQVYLQKQFPDGTKVKFGVNPPHVAELLKSFDTTVDDGIETKAEDKGDGMQRAIMLAIIQAFADFRKRQLGGGSFLFMIDEAEIHLHPSAQRLLKSALIDICITDQVFVNTHSSVLVVENNEHQKIFKVEKNNKITDINEVTDFEKMDIVFDLLGGSPSDLLLPRNFIIVEGRSDSEFIRGIVQRFYESKYKGIKILFAQGDIVKQESVIWAIHQLLVPLVAPENPIYKDRVIVLIDKPNNEQKDNYEKFRRCYPYLFNGGQVFELPKESLEEYYPAPFVKRKDELTLEKKVEYAKSVALQIDQNKFEADMKIILDALEAANEKSFNPVKDVVNK